MKTPKALFKRAIRRAWLTHSASEVSRRTLAHPLVRGMPRVSLTSQRATGGADGLTTARRLIGAYTLTRSHEEARPPMPMPQDDLWTRLIGTEFRQLLEILDSGDAGALLAYLQHFGEEYTWFGGLTLSVDGFTERLPASSIALRYLDKLICLAESVGVLPLENPEQSPRWGENLYVDVDEVVDAIERAIGISMVPPTGVVPVTGIATSHGPLHYRHLNALYAALRMRSLLPAYGGICEYGGGLGLGAYYANRLGFADYTLMDLPLVNVFSGYFLIGTLGGDAVRLYGENERTPAVNVLPYWHCMIAPSSAYSLALNQDSFPEIDPSLVLEYFRQIRRTTAEYFLSINQEAQASMGTRSQNSVPDLLRGNDGFHRMYRMRYWLREGYVEELYRLRV